MGWEMAVMDEAEEELRAALRAVKKGEDIGSKTLLALFHKDGKLPPGEDPIAVKTLNAFIGGRTSRRPTAMRVLRDWLHRVYGHHFLNREQPPPAEPPSLSATLTAFFASEAAHVANEYSVERMQTKFIGRGKSIRRYVMYRHDFQPQTQGIASRGEIRSSIVEISKAGEELNVTEIQDFIEPGTTVHYQQTNTGVLFPYGHYVMMFMKGVGFKSFKLGVIKTLYPGPGDKPVDRFQGVILVASRVALFPSVRFVCVGSENPKGGIIPFDLVPSEKARSWLRPSKEPSGHDVILA